MIPATLLLHAVRGRLGDHHDDAIRHLSRLREEGASALAIASQQARVGAFTDALRAVELADDEVSRMNTAEQVEAMERIVLEEV